MSVADFDIRGDEARQNAGRLKAEERREKQVFLVLSAPLKPRKFLPLSVREKLAKTIQN